MTDPRQAWIVFDLGFGDAGKGTITDALVRRHGARTVVRFNGGAQAGHTVVTDDGRAHVFSQLGAGSFVPGVRTHLAETVVVHPTALLVELSHLADHGVPGALERLTIAEGARLVTPLHQALGRLRELARGEARHGSCGVGIGEAVRDAMAAEGDAIRARDLGAPDRMRRLLARARERLSAELSALALPRGDEAARDERRILEDRAIGERWYEIAREVACTLVPAAHLGTILTRGPTVLEGAQGVLLDERFGFHPHTTWSDCTPAGARALLAAHGHDGELRTIAVTRTYTTRHGHGPMPTEDPALDDVLSEPHNESGGWQGRFRRGPLDLVLLRYATRVAGTIDGLAVTHCDRAPALPSIAVAYENARDLELFAHDADGLGIDLREGDLAQQERLARALSSVRPVLVPAGPPAALAERIAGAIGLPLAIRSAGPTARDKTFHR